MTHHRVPFRWLACFLISVSYARAEDSPTNPTALEVATAYVKAMWEHDIPAAKKVVTAASIRELDGVHFDDEKSTGDPPKIVKVSENGDSATAALESKDQTIETFKLVKEKGAWKVDHAAKAREDIAHARETRVGADIENLKTQLLLYEVQNGAIPSTQQGLNALKEKPKGEPVPRKWRPLIPDIPLDPWGTPYQYHHPGEHNKDGFDLFSAGPDHQPGTADDIGNWRR